MLLIKGWMVVKKIIYEIYRKMEDWEILIIV
jgi:hypothetical protein